MQNTIQFKKISNLYEISRFLVLLKINISIRLIIRDKMFRTTVDFKIGQLNTLKNLLFELNEKDNQLIFHIEGTDNNQNEYSLSFHSIVPLAEMLKFKLSESIDFMKYIDTGDIVFGKNGIYDLDTEIRIDIMQYLPKSFLLDIQFNNRDNLIGSIELTFMTK